MTLLPDKKSAEEETPHMDIVGEEAKKKETHPGEAETEEAHPEETETDETHSEEAETEGAYSGKAETDETHSGEAETEATSAEQAEEDIQDMNRTEEKTRQTEEAQMRGQRRFLHGMIFGALLAVVCMMAAILVPRAVRSLTGTGNPGAKVLTQSSTLTKLAQVRQIIEDYYLDEVDGELLEAYLFKGIAAGLDDDYASYYTAAELSDVMDSTKGEYYGIGASIGTDTQTGEFYVAEVYADSPAEEGGLETDDIVRAVDGETVDDLTLTELVSLIKSKDTFTLTIYRPDAEEELTLTITCSDVTPTYVTYEMMENQIGYLKLTEFTESAVEQFRDAVEALNDQGMEKLIVDLRDNPGGLLTSVCDILDEILPEDSLMVYTEDKNGNREEYTSDDEQTVTCEVAVLVNGGSASASEIFAGAVQDYGLGPIIGTQTYGKGVVQKTYTLSDGSAFKLTVENYYTPNGQEIDGNGITPDIVVEEDTPDGAEDVDGAASESTEDEGDPVQEGTEDGSGVTPEDTEEDNGTATDDAVLARALQELSD